MPFFPVRRVVTGFDPDGREVFTHDGEAPNSFDAGPVGVSELLWCGSDRVHVADDPDRTEPGFPLEPPAGGMSARVIRMPGIPPGTDHDETWLRIDSDDPERPGMHATDTLDLMVVLDGAVVMGLDDGSERTLTAGDYVVQRGTLHRWRPADHRGWTYLVAMLRPLDDRRPGARPDGLVPPHPGSSPVRRVITGEIALDAGAVVGIGGEMATLTDIWLTGGPLTAVDQGGDGDGAWTLDPPPGGVSFREVALSPNMPLVDEAWHTTATIDVDVILSGRVRLELPGEVSTELDPGDVVVQRGTNHRWVALGDEPMRMATLMVAATT
jgi:quercetin dioxygenase-like cupin family protein